MDHFFYRSLENRKIDALKISKGNFDSYMKLDQENLDDLNWWIQNIKGSCKNIVELNWLFNVAINDISVIYVTAHRCAGGLKKKLDLRSGSQRHRHFVGFFNVPVLAPTQDQPFYTVIPTHRPI